MARGKTKAAVDTGPVEGPWDLPDGWRWERLDIAAPVNPKRQLVGLDDTDAVAFVPMAAVSETGGGIDTSQRRQVGAVKAGFTRFYSGDVILAKITPCMENGKLAIIPDIPHGKGAGSTEFHVLEPKQLERKLLFYWLNRQSFRQDAEHNMTGTAGQKRVPTDWLRDQPVPIPPPELQPQIVARIDALFAEIDAGETALADARSGVETYRKSLLKAAVTGELTTDWRRDNPPQESGADLLCRILAERRTRWNADPKNARKKYVEPAGPDMNGLPELPEGWAWSSLQAVCDPRRPIAYGVLQPGADLTNGIPMIRVMDIRNGRVDAEALKKVSPSIAQKFPRTKLSGGEVLLTIVGSIGRTAIVPKKLAGANVARAVAVMPVLYADPRWIELLLRYEPYRLALEGASHEVARKTLNLEDVRLFPLPIPPSDEQTRLIELLNKGLDDADKLRTVTAADEGSTRQLRQSILAAAFRGDLTL